MASVISPPGLLPSPFEFGNLLGLRPSNHLSTCTKPVKIPPRACRNHRLDESEKVMYRSSQPRLPSSFELSPSVAALITDLRRHSHPRAQVDARSPGTLCTPRAYDHDRLTVSSILHRQQAGEKELSDALAHTNVKSSLELLLTPPDLDDLSLRTSVTPLMKRESSHSDGRPNSAVVGAFDFAKSIHTRLPLPHSPPSTPTTTSAFARSTQASSNISLSSLALTSCQSPSSRRRRLLAPMRQEPELILNTVATDCGNHPLATFDEAEEYAYNDESGPGVPLESSPVSHVDLPARPMLPPSLPPLSPASLVAVRSNIGASLKVLRSAARTFYSANSPLISKHNGLSDSICARNPGTDSGNDVLHCSILFSVSAPPDPSSYMTSIRMQTFKFERSVEPTSPRQTAHAGGALDTFSGTDASKPRQLAATIPLIAPRPRDMRENSAFIRIAVMEMAMRRCGKLDDKRPGRARWILPARKPSERPYLVADDGVPVRWLGVSC